MFVNGYNVAVIYLLSNTIIFETPAKYNYLFFLSMLLLQSNMPGFVLQNTGSNKMLNLGCFGPR